MTKRLGDQYEFRNEAIMDLPPDLITSMIAQVGVTGALMLLGGFIIYNVTKSNGVAIEGFVRAIEEQGKRNEKDYNEIKQEHRELKQEHRDLKQEFRDMKSSFAREKQARQYENTQAINFINRQHKLVRALHLDANNQRKELGKRQIENFNKYDKKREAILRLLGTSQNQ